MRRRIRYNIGDVFLIELENGLKGVGRVLKSNKATVFIELYKVKLINDKREIDWQSAIKEKPLSMTWCYDDGLKSGEWEIFDNKPIEGEIIMPYFWTQDAQMVSFILKKEQILIWEKILELKLAKKKLANMMPMV